ncbi:MarR family winged helix-turn-helix transcriptional regulator [Rubellimicrobium arenae]|uniref:MarR family winged helix-turn-helix transcriptional regulator n=1 Tax=Rubellimicrobium arenae TaxID=2817372 RepID=UPI001B3131D0|nr:MarR family transcriptional regulator [Rubellimicrobium arenae]
MTERSVRLSFLFATTRVTQGLKRHFDERARAHGLTYSRARLLTLVARNPGVTQAELARLMEVEPPTMKHLLDGLEEGGFVQRCPVEGNRRANQVFLTERAETEHAGILRFLEDLAEELFDDVPDEDLAGALRLLDRISAKLAGESS